MTSMPITMVPQTTSQTPPDTGVWDKGAVTCPTPAARVQCTCNRAGCTGCRTAAARSASKLFGCAPAAVADILDRAADRIQARGLWLAGHSNTTVIGDAICGGAGRLNRALIDAALAAVAAHSHLTDAPGRTSAEVCGELRACAAGLRITSDASGYRTVSALGVTA